MAEVSAVTIIQLATFVKIAEVGSFTTAANQLGYAQSTVTTQIKQLEDELGCPLFERLGRYLKLTEEGRKLLDYAGRMLQLEREILMEVPADREPSGILKLGVSESLCYERLPKILMKFKSMFPKVEIRLQFVMHETYPELLRKGELDMVYTLNPYREDESLTILDMQPETLGFYTSPDHPLAKKKGVTEQDLEGCSLLLTGHGCSFRKMILEELEDRRIVPDIALETSSKEILKQFASKGLGVAFIPDMSVVKGKDDGMLQRLNWDGSEFRIFSQLLIHKDKRISKAMEGLIDLITNDAT